MNTRIELSSLVTTSTPVANATTPDPATTNAILAVMQGYGYSENEGMARRQQRALALVLQGHFTAKDLTMTAEGLPVVTRFHVQSGSGGGHYHVTKTPNEPGTYDCTCPDRFLPATCKHRYGAALLQDGLMLTHEHRLDLPAYRHTLRTLQSSPPSHPFGSHELAALQVLLNTTEIYDALAQEAARQFYSANRSYASQCFSAMVDKARWAYGAGYGGNMVNYSGTIRSVLAGRPVIGVRWEPLELRWYVVGEDGSEDTGATAALLHPAIPEWGTRRWYEEEPFLPAEGFEEEPEGHYALPESA
jgi:hypothetical protein